MAEQVKNALSSEDLARFAAESTEAVRLEAERNGSLLPIWQDGRVVYVNPVTGKGTKRDDDLTALLAELGVKKLAL
jgi:hypothetical protein